MPRTKFAGFSKSYTHVVPGKICVMFATMMFVAASNVAFASPKLICQIDQGGKTIAVSAVASSDPYSFKAVNINDRFRFRAVVVGNDASIDYIKLYTYYQSGQRSLILQEEKYLSPEIPVTNAVRPVTGVVTLYSPRMGREIVYSCSLNGESQ